jgi:hypothetical protein
MVACEVRNKRSRGLGSDPAAFVLDGTAALIVMADRRSDEGERREHTRTGRRASDPRPKCSACGLVVEHGVGHSSDRECIDALQEEIKRLRSFAEGERE